MAEPEGAKPTPNPEAAKPAATARVDATKYVGTAGGGNLKGGGIRRAFFRGDRRIRNDRQAAAAAGVGGSDGVPDRMVCRAFFPIFLPRTLSNLMSVIQDWLSVGVCARR